MTQIYYIIGTPNKDLSKLTENQRYFEITDYSGGGTTIDANTINALLGGGNVSNSVVNGLVKLNFDDSAFLTTALANTTYLSKTDASNLYQPKGTYVTTASLATTLTSYPTNASLTTTLGPYAKKTDIPNLDGYAKKTEIPDVSVFENIVEAAYVNFIDNPLKYKNKTSFALSTRYSRVFSKAQFDALTTINENGMQFTRVGTNELALEATTNNIAVSNFKIRIQATTGTSIEAFFKYQDEDVDGDDQESPTTSTDYIRFSGLSRFPLIKGSLTKISGVIAQNALLEISVVYFVIKNFTELTDAEKTQLLTDYNTLKGL